MLPCARYLAMLAAGVLWQQGPARAGDLEDCKSAIAEKVQLGCTAVIKAPSGSVDGRTIAYVNRSRFFANHAKPDLALKDADAAIALNPRSALALSARAYVHQRAGRFDQAISDFTAAAQLDPGNPGIWTSRGLVKNEQNARADFDKAIALRRDFVLAYIGRARGYIETAELDKALSDLNTAISINPAAQSAFFLRAVVYRRQGDVDKAIDDVTRAIKRRNPIRRPFLHVPSSSSPRATMPAPSLISISCSPCCPATRRSSASVRPRSPCRRHSPRCGMRRGHRRLQQLAKQ